MATRLYTAEYRLAGIRYCITVEASDDNEESTITEAAQLARRMIDNAAEQAKMTISVIRDDALKAIAAGAPD